MMDGLRQSRHAYEKASAVLAGGVSSGIRRTFRPQPIYFEAGQGPYVHDIDGNSYVDHILGWGQSILGHCNAAQAAAVSEQLARGTSHGSGSLLEVAVAERVLERVPCLERLLWATTGSEAVQLALRLARAATGRNRFLKFGGHYHGWTDAMLPGARNDRSAGDHDVESLGQNPRLRDDVDVVPFGDLESVRARVVGEDRDIAAIFVDPLMCNSGLIAPPEGFLAGLRAICDRSGALLIFDEVITGFRVARGGAIERFDVSPDLVVYAKAISGGFPLAAVAGRADVLDLVRDGVFYSGTYNGNLASLAAAASCLDQLADSEVHSRFERLGSRLAQGLTRAFETAGRPATIRQVGPLLHCATGADYPDIAEGLLGHGIYVSPDGRLYLSTAHTDREIDATITAFSHVVEKL